MIVYIVSDFSDGFTSYRAGNGYDVSKEVALRWIADGKASQSSVSGAGIPVTGTENMLAGSAGSVSLTGAGNVTLGYLAGEDLTVGNSNTLVGNKAGMNIAGSGDGNLFGGLNTCIGSEAGGNITSGYANTLIGQKAGVSITTTSGNVAIGKSAMAAPVATRVVAIGQGAAELSTASLQDSVYIGYGAGNAACSNNSVVVGAGTRSGTGSEQVVIGQAAGAALTSGSNLTVIGQAAGTSLTSGSSHVLIGRRAGVGITTAAGITAVGTYAGESEAGAGRNILLGFSARVPSGTTNAFVAGSPGDTGGSNIAFISNVYFGHGVVHTAPGAYTINGTGGSGTNIAGGGVRIAGGRGTGTGAGGSLLFATAPAGSSGAVANALVDHMTLDEQGRFFPKQATTAAAPPHAVGAMYFDTTLNKLRIGGASGWETVTSA